MSEPTQEEQQRMAEVEHAVNPMTEPRKLSPVEQRIADRVAKAAAEKDAKKDEREAATLRKRKSRANQKIRETALQAATQEECWELMKTSVNPEIIAELEKQQEDTEDMLYWMRTGCDVPPDDECFIGLYDGLAMLEEFIEARGFICDSTKFNNIDLTDFQPGWGVWVNYWKDWRLEALCAENEATKIFALYGIRIGMPQYHYGCWRGEINPQHAAFGCKNPECWLCRFRANDPKGVAKLASAVYKNR
jgi:hypothetical protein